MLQFPIIHVLVCVKNYRAENTKLITRTDYDIDSLSPVLQAAIQGGGVNYVAKCACMTRHYCCPTEKLM